MPQLKIPIATPKTQHGQINRQTLFKKRQMSEESRQPCGAESELHWVCSLRQGSDLLCLSFLCGCRYQQDLLPWAEESLDEMIRVMYSEQSLAL